MRLRSEEKLGPAAIARRFGISRASVYGLLGKKEIMSRPTGGMPVKPEMREIIRKIDGKSADGFASGVPPAFAKGNAHIKRRHDHFPSAGRH
jgi:hypothetical protein